MSQHTRKNDTFGEIQYRQSALERLLEAETLSRNGHFGGSVYLAGRGVEGMLRAVIWKRDLPIRLGLKSLETGHDVRELLAMVRDLGLLRSDGHDDEFVA